MKTIKGEVTISTEDYEVLKSKALAFEELIEKEYRSEKPIRIPVSYNEWAYMNSFTSEIFVLTRDEIILKMEDERIKLQKKYDNLEDYAKQLIVLFKKSDANFFRRFWKAFGTQIQY